MMPSQAKKWPILAVVILTAAALVVCSPLAAMSNEAVGGVRHEWGSGRINATLWGIARGDMDGDGRRDLVVMEKTSLWIARIEGTSIARAAQIDFPPATEGLRLFMMDVDGDGRDDAVVSAVANGAVPSSFIVSHRDGKLVMLAAAIPWHLRVIGSSSHTSLIGQRSSGNDFFSGKLYRLAYNGGKIAIVEPLDLPRWANIFTIALLPPRIEGQDELASLAMYAPLKGFERQGKRWKKFWTSDGRFGGTLRFVERVTRPPLDDIPEYRVPIGHEPIAARTGGTTLLIAARHDMPLKNIVGQGQLILGGRLIAYVRDEALGFTETFISERLPGFIADYVLDLEGGVPMLYAVVQTDPEVFSPSPQSSIVTYRLATPQSPLAPRASTDDASAATTP